MALPKQIVPVSLAQGVDTKSDPKGVIPGKLLTLENGVFTSPKSIRKRNGFAQLAPTITTGRALASYGSELLAFDKVTMYSMNAAASSMTSKGALSSVVVSRSPIIRNTYQQTVQDCAIHSNGMRLYAWEDTQGGSRYCLIDSSTGQVLTNQQISATAIKPKTLVVGTYLVIFWVNTSDSRIYGATVPVGSPSTALTPVVLTPTSGNAALKSTAPNFDACVYGSHVAIAYNDSTVGGGVSLVAAPVATPFALTVPTVVATSAGSVVTVFPDSYTGGPVVAWQDGTNVKYNAFDSSLTSLASATIESQANTKTLTGVSTSSTALALTLFWGVTAANTYDALTRTCTITGSYSVSTPSTLCRSVAASSKAFTYNATAYVTVAHSSTLQPTYFVLDGAGNVVAKLLPGLGGGYPTRGTLGAVMLPEVNASGATYELALLEKDLLTTSSGAVYTQVGVSSFSLNYFNPESSYLREEIGNNLHISGGFLQMYDGVSPVEHGFHLYPENVSASVTGPNTGTTKSYQYAVVYEWVDNQGQTHRSAPSPALTQTTANAISDADADHRVTLTIPTLRVTAKKGSRSPVTIAVYRTADAGTTFYLSYVSVGSTNSPTDPIVNDPTADTVTFVDNVTDAELIGNPLLYTNGGVVENIAPNACTSLVVHRDRLWALDSTMGSWWYSKEVIPGAPAEFSDLFQVNVDPRGGVPIAGASLDDKFIIFKSDRVFFVAGRGPTSTGIQNDLSDAIPVTTDCGCTNPRSVVNIPAGVMFKGAKGIYLLDRNLAVSYVGAEVEAYNSANITSAVLLTNYNQVRFTLDTGVALVFDYLMGQWSVFTPIRAVDAIIHGGEYSYLTDDGLILKETPGVFSDNGAFIKLRAVTGWLQFAGIQGFQRAYKALILGSYASAHQLYFKVAYDFAPDFVQSVVISPTTPNTYGQDSVYGGDATIATDDSVYGGDGSPYQWAVSMSRQKCQAIQISIEDVYTGTVGESLSLFALTFEVGAKAGPMRVSQSRSLG